MLLHSAWDLMRHKSRTFVQHRGIRPIAPFGISRARAAMLIREFGAELTCDNVLATPRRPPAPNRNAMLAGALELPDTPHAQRTLVVAGSPASGPVGEVMSREGVWRVALEEEMTRPPLGRGDTRHSSCTNRPTSSDANDALRLPICCT